jgi:hypothetical protein
MYHFPRYSTIPGCDVVDDTGSRMTPRYVHGPNGDGEVPYAMQA